MQEFISQLKQKNPDLKESEIEGLLTIIKTTSNLTNTTFVHLTGLPKEILRIFKESLGDLLIVSSGENISPSKNFAQLLDRSDLKSYAWSFLTLGGTAVEGQLAQIRHKYNLEPKREYDQFFATASTSVAKAQIIAQKGMLNGKNVALLGDDDLVAITASLLASKTTSAFTLQPKITVFDIDLDILNIIKKIASDLNFSQIITRQYDVRKPLYKEEAQSYDVVIMDPPYTKSGIELFLNRGIELLKRHTDYSGKYIFLYYGQSFKSPEKTLKIQELFTKYNLVIEDKIDKFARYNGAESIGSASSLYILKTTPHTHGQDLNFLTDIYTYQPEAAKEAKFPFVDHIVVKVFNVSQQLLISRKSLSRAIEKLCRDHKLKIVDTKITAFKNQGLTITHVLANSNLVIHAWPEYNALHFDLITCVPIYNKSHLAHNICDIFKTKKIEIREVE